MPASPSDGGERTRACDCQVVEAPWPLALERKATRRETNSRIWRRPRGGRGRDTEAQRDPRQANPPEDDRDLGAGRGRKRWGRTGAGLMADAGTWRGLQGRAEEARVWRVRETPRWAALRTGRGVGEQVKQEGSDEERLRMKRR